MSKWKEWFQGPQDITKAEAVEDYSVGRVPSRYRWPIAAIILVLLGNSTAMFFFTYGAEFAYTVGWPTMLIPIFYFFVGATIIGACTMKIASKEGLSMSLLTRGLGFGYLGSAVTSLIYAVNYIFYFIFEGTIVTHAIANYAGIGINSIGGIAIFAGLGFITIWFVWKGMSSMQFLQTWGVPIFLILFLVGLYNLSVNYDVIGVASWMPSNNVTATTMWMALNMANGQLVFQGLLATDYGRFAKPNITYKGTATIMVGMLIPMLAVIFLGAMLAYTLLPTLDNNAYALASDPGFVFPIVMGILGVVFAIVTQIRINVMNLYSGSLALSNTMDSVFNYRPGRQWWMIAVWLLGVIFYAVNVLQYMNTFLAITGILTNTWVFIILADYYICRKVFKLAPSDFVEYRQEYLHSWNPAGIISLSAAVFIGALGVLDVYPIYYASFFAMLTGPVLHVMISVMTKGRYYFSKFPTDVETSWTARL
ncbi:purine-cytosine permease family protein [Cohnella boryungensis]|uniref:Purine-cytosine permease family protein n=1 Tax=Cohnella boryungensis TaxID=768479 RepID=A0ABV8SFY9_9BACL